MGTSLLQPSGQPVDLPLGETDNCLFNFGQRVHGNKLAHCVAQTTLMQRALTLHVEAELDDVAVLDDVFFAFDAELAGFAGFGVRVCQFRSSTMRSPIKLANSSWRISVERNPDVCRFFAHAQCSASKARQPV